MAVVDDEVKDLLRHCTLLLSYFMLTLNSFVFSTEHVQFAFKLLWLYKKPMKLTG